MFQRIIILVTFLLLGAVTGLQKLTGDFAPDWFIEKFQDTILNLFPGSLVCCYMVIILLELLLALFFILAIIRMEFKPEADNRFSVLGFNTSLVLFAILFFGSFLSKDYENGFMDLGYLTMTVYLSHQFDKK